MTEGQSGRVKGQQEVDKATGDNRGPQGMGHHCTRGADRLRLSLGSHYQQHREHLILRPSPT